MAENTNTEREALLELIDAYAEARHVGGCHTYNAKTAEARAEVTAALDAAASPYAPCYVCGRPMDGLSEDDCHCFHRKELRASLSLPAAGQEPVAPLAALMEFLRAELSAIPCRYRGDPSYDHDAYWMRARVEMLLDEAERIFSAAPQPAVAAGWVNLPGQMPEPCKPVLLDIGRKYPIRAMWAPKFTLPTDGDVDYGEYDEATDDYYCHEGWYEWNQNEETHWAVSETPRAWAPLPPTTSADSRKGE